MNEGQPYIFSSKVTYLVKGIDESGEWLQWVSKGGRFVANGGDQIRHGAHEI